MLMMIMFIMIIASFYKDITAFALGFEEFIIKTLDKFYDIFGSLEYLTYRSFYKDWKRQEFHSVGSSLCRLLS